MNVTTKIILTTSKVVGLFLWVAVLYTYGVIDLIGDYVTAVINFNINYVCYK